VASYRIQIKRSAQKEILAVGSKKDRQRIVRRIEELASDPRPPGVEKLSGSPYYRVRQGTYRIVYEIQDDVLIVHILKVGHRKDVYR
jgi:mRNA interferase RelE/StbE